MRALRLGGPRGPCPERPALTGISRARWSAGGRQLPAPPRAAARGTGSRPAIPRAGPCGPPPPSWTPAPPATPAPTWPLEPAGGEGCGPGAAPPPSSSAGSRLCGCGPLAGVGGCGEPGWWAARAGAGGHGAAGGPGGGGSAAPRGGAPPCPPRALLPVESGQGDVASLYRSGNGGPGGSGLLAPFCPQIWAASWTLPPRPQPGCRAAGRAAPSRLEGGERSGSPSQRGLGSGLRGGAPGGRGVPVAALAAAGLRRPLYPGPRLGKIRHPPSSGRAWPCFLLPSLQLSPPLQDRVDPVALLSPISRDPTPGQALADGAQNGLSRVTGTLEPSPSAKS